MKLNSEVLRTHVKDGAGKSANWLVAWVREPGNVKGSGVRVLWIGAAVIMWFMCVRSSPVVTLVLTPLALVGVFLWFSLKDEEAPTPARKSDEFWEKNTPQVSLDKATESDDEQTVRPRPKTEETPAENENVQVSGLSDARTAEGDGEVTGNDVQVDHVGIFPVTQGRPEGQPEVSEPQVNRVSGHSDTGQEQATSDITHSDEDTPEDLVALMLRLADKGASVREIAQATGLKRSTVQDRLKKAREQRNHKEMTTAAGRATHTGGTPVPQVVLPGAWYGEDGHAQDVRFTGDAVSLSTGRSQDESVPVMEFIRLAFLGKAETTTENWSVSVDDGTIRGSVTDQQAEFRGFWSETGTVVISKVSLH